jgi:Uma2 family endonuclease
MSVTGRLTAEEYLERDFPPYTQLIDGEVVVNQPSARHQRIAFHIAYRIRNWTEVGGGSGEAGFGIDWTVGDRDVFVPDVWWVPDEHRLARDALRGYTYPDLVVEVRSPSTWRHDIGIKRARYEQAGVRELWLVDTDSDTVMIDRRSAPHAPAFDDHFVLGAGDMLTSPLLPGFALEVDELFDR